jgi:trk system potassium uptake protein
VVVVGCGRVGSGLAVGLAQQGHGVAILDKQPRAFRRLPAGWPGTTVVGSGFDRDDLDKAGAGTADALAAVTSGDNSNILTARIARENYGIANVVARIYDPRRAEIYQRLGIPTVATVTWTIDQVLRRLLPDTVTGEWTDATGQLVLVEHLLPEAWAGKRLYDLGLEGRANLVAVTRGGVPRLDVAAMVGQEGDILHVAVMKDAMADLERQISTGEGTPMTKPFEGRRRP